MSNLRSQVIRLASALPPHSDARRQLLAVLSAPVEKKADSPTSPTVRDLMGALNRVPGVKSVYVTDTWPQENWYHLRVVLETKATVEGHRQLGANFDIKLRATGGYVTVYNIPDFKRTIAGIRAVVRQSGVSVDNISSPTKLYEYQDAWDKAHAKKGDRLGGYDENEVSVEFWDR